MDNADIALMLGEIKGELEGIKASTHANGVALTSIDNRLRNVEINAAKSGAVAGGVMSVAVALVSATAKTITGA